MFGPNGKVAEFLYEPNEFLDRERGVVCGLKRVWSEASFTYCIAPPCPVLSEPGRALDAGFAGECLRAERCAAVERGSPANFRAAPHARDWRSGRETKPKNLAYAAKAKAGRMLSGLAEIKHYHRTLASRAKRLAKPGFKVSSRSPQANGTALVQRSVSHGYIQDSNGRFWLATLLPQNFQDACDRLAHIIHEFRHRFPLRIAARQCRHFGPKTALRLLVNHDRVLRHAPILAQLAWSG